MWATFLHNLRRADLSRPSGVRASVETVAVPEYTIGARRNGRSWRRGRKGVSPKRSCHRGGVFGNPRLLAARVAVRSFPDGHDRFCRGAQAHKLLTSTRIESERAYILDQIAGLGRMALRQRRAYIVSSSKALSPTRPDRHPKIRISGLSAEAPIPMLSTCRQAGQSSSTVRSSSAQAVSAWDPKVILAAPGRSAGASHSRASLLPGHDTCLNVCCRASSAGFTLLETMVAMVIFAGAAMALYALFNANLIALNRAYDVSHQMKAVRHAANYLSGESIHTRVRRDSLTLTGSTSSGLPIARARSRKPSHNGRAWIFRGWSFTRSYSRSMMAVDCWDLGAFVFQDTRKPGNLPLELLPSADCISTRSGV